MHLLSLLAALATITPSAAPDHGARCSPTPRNEWWRPDTADVVVLRMSADSMLVGAFEFDEPAFPRVPRLGPPPREPVYGQRATLVRAGMGARTDRVRSEQDVVVVWWSMTSLCRRAKPYRANALPAGEPLVLTIAPQPKEEWVNGVPTYHVFGRDHQVFSSYAPHVWREAATRAGVATLPVMSIDEYLELYSALPTESEVRADASSARRELLAWADRHPELARRRPAVHLIDGVRGGRMATP